MSPGGPLCEDPGVDAWRVGGMVQEGIAHGEGTYSRRDENGDLAGLHENKYIVAAVRNTKIIAVTRARIITPAVIRRHRTASFATYRGRNKMSVCNN